MVSEIVGLQKVDKAWLDARPDLKVLGVNCTGLDLIDEAECERRGIKVISLRGETKFLKNILATAEHTIGLILALMRNTPWAFYDVLQGNWNREPFIGRELKGKTLGIVGPGRVGKQVSKIAKAFGMRVLTYDRGEPEENLTNILNEADVISLHIPLEGNEGFFSANKFASMKNGSYFLNTSRGAIIDEQALLLCLELGRLAGAALDVVQNEPDINPQLLEYARHHQNLLLTPHISGATMESMSKTRDFIAEKVKDYLQENGL
jgi:D-3-phosphoglycerate dehydrogenase